MFFLFYIGILVEINDMGSMFVFGSGYYFFYNFFNCIGIIFYGFG